MYSTPTSFGDQRRRRRERARVVGLGASSSGGWGAGAGTSTALVNVGGNVARSAQIGGGAAQTGMTVAAGAGAIFLSVAPVAWIPIAGPIIAGVMIAIQLIINRKGPKQKRATTDIVNAIEPQLKANLEAYKALPVHYASAQEMALMNFDAGWDHVQDQCNIPEMGNPGIACTADRRRGGRWDWFAYYRDPIANDTQVVPDPSSLDQAVNGAGLGGSVNIGGTSVPVPLLLGGALLLVAMSMGGGGGGGKR